MEIKLHVHEKSNENKVKNLPKKVTENYSNSIQFNNFIPEYYIHIKTRL